MRGVPLFETMFLQALAAIVERTPPREKKLSEPGGTVFFLTYHRGGTWEKVLAGAAFWSFGTSKLGFSLLPAGESPQW